MYLYTHKYNKGKLTLIQGTGEVFDTPKFYNWRLKNVEVINEWNECRAPGRMERALV